MRSRDKYRLALGLAILALGGLSIALGAVRGETAVVLRKAVNICFECVGLG